MWRWKFRSSSFQIVSNCFFLITWLIKNSRKTTTRAKSCCCLVLSIIINLNCSNGCYVRRTSRKGNWKCRTITSWVRTIITTRNKYCVAFSSQFHKISVYGLHISEFNLIIIFRFPVTNWRNKTYYFTIWKSICPS